MTILETRVSILDDGEPDAIPTVVLEAFGPASDHLAALVLWVPADGTARPILQVRAPDDRTAGRRPSGFGPPWSGPRERDFRDTVRAYACGVIKPPAEPGAYWLICDPGQTAVPDQEQIEPGPAPLAPAEGPQGAAGHPRTAGDRPAIVPAPVRPSGRTSGPWADEAYLQLFLEAADLPAGMTRHQDSRTRGADPGDQAFAQYGGLQSGLARWGGGAGHPIDRLIDIRWLFPAEGAATAYHQATLQTNAEGMPPLASAPSVGQTCRVFGGTVEMLGTRVTSYLYLFTVGPAAVKLYLAEAADAQLPLELVTSIAQRIPPRITAALGVSSAQSTKPWWRRLFSG